MYFLQEKTAEKIKMILIIVALTFNNYFWCALEGLNVFKVYNKLINLSTSIYF